jgi:hypothetical protein
MSGAVAPCTKPGRMRAAIGLGRTYNEDQGACLDMQELHDALVSFFEGDGWAFNLLGEPPVLQLPFRGENGSWACVAQGRDEQEQCVFYSLCPVDAPEQRRPAVAEFLTRANYGLVVGNFELDYEDGEIRFKTSIDVADDRLSPALIRNIVYANVLVMDRYLPGILQVIYGQVPPIDAIRQVEG